MSRVLLCLVLLGASLLSAVASYKIEKLDLMLVIDDSYRLMYVGGGDGRVHAIVSALLEHLRSTVRDFRIGLVTYNDKTILPFIDCSYSRHNYCSKLQQKLRYWHHHEDLLNEIDKIPYSGAASDLEAMTDVYSGIMTALGHDDIEWRSYPNDPVYRAVFVIAGAAPREGGQQPYGGLPDRLPNNGRFHADCGNQDYYSARHVISALEQKNATSYIVRPVMFNRDLDQLLLKYPHGFMGDLLWDPSRIAEGFVRVLDDTRTGFDRGESETTPRTFLTSDLDTQNVADEGEAFQTSELPTAHDTFPEESTPDFVEITTD